MMVISANPAHGRRALLTLSAMIAVAVPAHACNVPVFRYALERWPADLFDVVVLHRGELSESDAAAVEAIRKQSQAHRGTANIEVVDCDVAQPLEGELSELWEQQSPSAQLPWVVLRSPGAFGYTVRVLPRHAGLASAAGLGLVANA